MPNIDGFDPYKKIKELDNNVKVCFFTAGEMYYKNYRLKEYPLIEEELFIHKPNENDKLINKIKKIMGS